MKGLNLVQTWYHNPSIIEGRSAGMEDETFELASNHAREHFIAFATS